MFRETVSYSLAYSWRLWTFAVILDIHRETSREEGHSMARLIYKEKVCEVKARWLVMFMRRSCHELFSAALFRAFVKWVLYHRYVAALDGRKREAQLQLLTRFSSMCLRHILQSVFFVWSSETLQFCRNHRLMSRCTKFVHTIQLSEAFRRWLVESLWKRFQLICIPDLCLRVYNRVSLFFVHQAVKIWRRFVQYINKGMLWSQHTMDLLVAKRQQQWKMLNIIFHTCQRRLLMKFWHRVIRHLVSTKIHRCKIVEEKFHRTILQRSWYTLKARLQLGNVECTPASPKI